MNFKSQALPCVQVIGIDGRPCQSFSPKPTADTRSKSDDRFA
ncbi:hypothetical protein OAM79_03080 [Litorivicinus sp.]|nr:hypothetical protein [Litorivicinus sp.]MDG1156621.1 hypothetical protein [Litorivicinaceae bacterium]